MESSELIAAPCAEHGGRKWEIVRKLGEGAYAIVYEAVERNTAVAAVLKLEKGAIWPSYLEEEWDMYKLLPKHATGFANPSHFFEQNSIKVMVMPLLGRSLGWLLDFCAGKFSLETVLLLADQLLYRLQTLHQCSIVHRDISLANCLMGSAKAGNIVHLVDFGMSTNVRDVHFMGNKPIDKAQLAGNPAFASLSAHHGKGTSPFDDLESLSYMLVYMRKGCLPWIDLNNHQAIFEMKRSLKPSEICRGLEREFTDLLGYARHRDKARPEYPKLRSWFRRLFTKRNFKHRLVFDWTRIVYSSLQEDQPENQRKANPRRLVNKH